MRADILSCLIGMPSFLVQAKTLAARNLDPAVVGRMKQEAYRRVLQTTAQPTDFRFLPGAIQVMRTEAAKAAGDSSSPSSSSAA